VIANHATRARARVALITCRALATLEDDDRLLIAPLAERGVAAEPVVWDDPAVDWAAFDLAVLRSPWDYAPRRDEFVAWAATVPSLANPADVVARNTDKRYLADLATAGVPVAPTTWLTPGGQLTLPASGEWVIKPVISMGSLDTGRYDLSSADHRALAAAHVARLSDAGRYTMLQPYLPAVDSYGETALVFLGGEYSHAIRKGPMLDGPYRGVKDLYKEEVITARTPTVAERAVADAVLAALPDADRLLYARVDLIPGPDESPVLVELELTEPSLFLGYADGAADRLAAAITRHLRRS
jgi:hypothetical protein